MIHLTLPLGEGTFSHSKAFIYPSKPNSKAALTDFVHNEQFDYFIILPFPWECFF